MLGARFSQQGALTCTKVQNVHAGVLMKPKIAKLWYCPNEAEWKAALNAYWEYVKPQNLALEKELDTLHLRVKGPSDIEDWYSFLLYKYFPWKYTDCRWHPEKYFMGKYSKSGSGKRELSKIVEQLFKFNRKDIKQGLSIALNIKGLGVPGASGLLSLLFPNDFGTVDKFVVKALRKVENLPEKAELQKINHNSLTISDGVLLIQIMRKKAAELNSLFNSSFWSPRKVDKVLWSARDC